jgi:hypothetical protein
MGISVPRPRLEAALAVLLAVSAVGAGCAAGPPSDGSDEGVDALSQRTGDPVKGRIALLNNGLPNKPFISCGVPYTLYSKLRGPTPGNLRIPGRLGHNADLPYYLSTAVTRRNVEVVSANCLFCHGGQIDNQVIVGLGDSTRDFTWSGAIAGPVQQVVADAAAFVAGLGANERAELDRFMSHMKVTAKYVQTDTVGLNPAATMFGLFAGFRDRATLVSRPEPEAWLENYIDQGPAVLVSDAPSWWTTAKKRRAIYYGGFGVGDHARLMLNASLLCLDDADEAQEIDAYVGDIRSYIMSVQPPRFPRDIDMSLAAKGEVIYEARCEGCHGSPKKDVYPDRMIPLLTVGTDARYDDLMAGDFGNHVMDWFNTSWWGTHGHTAKLEMPATRGYIAPPLDGVWATAPYLHNGSVPTLEALLDSSKRPRYWLRTFDSTDYDWQAVGWKYTELSYGKHHITNALREKKVYDTTEPGLSNAGHSFGDDLAPDDRAALIEFLKTL